MGRKKNPQNNYWNQAVEDAVCGYNSATTQEEREKHYRIIYPALCKVAEVMYHKVKFSYSDDDMQDTMAECVIHLTENLHKFKCGIGTKAFSYFTVSARFFYIQLSNKNYRYFQKTIPISTMTENWDVENGEMQIENDRYQQELYYAFLQYIRNNFEQIVPKIYEGLAKILLHKLENFEIFEEINRRKILNEVFLEFSNRDKDRSNLTRLTNILSSQFTLFSKRWSEGNTSMELCQKDTLSDWEKEYVRKNIKIGKGNNGAAGISKKLGVNIKVINEYTKTLT